MIKKIAVGILIAGLLGVIYFTQGIPIIFSKKIAQETVDFINEMNEITYGEDVPKAELVKVTYESGIYKIGIMIEGREETIYATKDGKLYIHSVFNIKETLAEIRNELEEAEIPQTEIPHVELFIVSFCPYSTLAEKTLLPVYDLLKDKVDWDIHYITQVIDDVVYSMHGESEIEQNQREVCVLEKFGISKWWQFVDHINDNCEDDASCWEEAAQIAGINSSSINECVSSEGLELMQREATKTNLVGVTGSPTLFINGAESRSVYDYGDPQAYLDAICSAFSSVPEECSQKLDNSETLSSAIGGSCQ